MTTRVFISYRRKDSDAQAGRICATLKDALGEEAVFQDISAMRPGSDFPEEIEQALNAAQVVLVVMGPRWFLGNKWGKRRIDDPEDWVRREILTALKKNGTSVIPVLVEDAEMPPPEALPDDIADLTCRLAAVPIRTDFWDHDLRPLVEQVANSCGVDIELTRPPSGSQVPAGYLDWVKRKYGTVELLGLEASEAHAGRLRQVYVPAVTSRRLDRVEIDQEFRDERLLEGMPGPREEDDSPALLLEMLGEHSAYVPGEPGAGKSTFCRWLAWVVAEGSVPAHGIPAPEDFRETLPASLSGKLPLLVELRDFWPHLKCGPGVQQWHRQQLEKSLADWLDETAPGGLSGEAFLDHLAKGRVVLALDGVDEVPAAHRNGGATFHPRTCLLSGLADAARDWHEAGNRVILTSRPYGLNDVDVRRLELPALPLGPLPEPLQDLFIERWYAATDTGKREENTQGLKSHLAERDDLDQLTASPLLLTALCIRFAQGQRLPDDLFDLYDGLVASVLFLRYGADPGRLELVRSRLAAIAYGMHTGTESRRREIPEARVTNDEADEHLRAFADINWSVEDKRQKPAERRKSLLSESGLLQAAGAGHVQFYHLSFQEFLSADHLSSTCHSDAEFLDTMRQHGGEKSWRPTLMFLFTGLADRNRQWSLKLLTELAADLSRKQVANNPARAAFVAQCAEVLLKKGSSLGPLSDELRQLCLYAIEDEVELKDRHVLSLALGRLGDPRILKAKDTAGFIEIAAGKYRDAEGNKTTIESSFLLSRFPVINSQFAEFIEAGGYRNADYWSKEGTAWLEKAEVSEPEYWRNSRYNAPNQPVVGVSYWEAEAYCRWAGCRLPTSDEWGGAAGGRAGREYPWGNDWEDGICNTHESGLRALSAVGIFPRSRQADFGLEDMAGNVWEWCAAKGEFRSCVVRGGSWYLDQDYARADPRYGGARPYDRFNGIGFRVVLCSPIC